MGANGIMTPTLSRRVQLTNTQNVIGFTSAATFRADTTFTANIPATTDLTFQEVGVVISIGDGVAKVTGLTGVEAGERVQFESGVSGIALNLEKDLVGVALFGNDNQVSEGNKVTMLRNLGDEALANNTRALP